MMQHLASLWSPLALEPLLWLVATLVAYALGVRLQLLAGGTPLVSPVLIAILLVAAAVAMTHISYRAYFAGAQFINFLLGPATVALAVPLAKNIGHVGRSLRGVSVALLAGSVATTASGLLFVRLFGGSEAVALSMAPKAATTPVAMSIAQTIGGVPPLTAVLAITGGIFAASVGKHVLIFMKIDDQRSHGLAAGVAGSGVGAAHAASLGGVAAAFAALGVALNGVITSVLAPLVAMAFH